MATGPRILFAPVSGPRGVGEYMRSLYVAEEMARRLPGSDIRFIVSSAAPYAEEIPYPVFTTARSPTKHVKEVNEIVSLFRPDVMIFDCSGRVAQFRHASLSGCRTVFVSQHKRKRRRGFKPARMKYCDLHWIVQPEFVDGGLTWLEKSKLRWLGRPRVTFLGPVFSPPQPPTFDLPPSPYFFCCAGGGGNRVGDRNSAELFAEAAAVIAEESGRPGLMVMGPNYTGGLTTLPGLRIVSSLSGAEVAHILGTAEFAVLGGGDMLGQAVALGVPAVAAPVAGDQPSRIAAYVGAGLCVGSNPRDLAVVARRRFTSEARSSLKARIVAAGMKNGLREAVDQLVELVERPGSGGTAGS